jgi:site-specific recombinase XerD
MKGCRPLTDEEISMVSKSFSGKYAVRDKALFILGVTWGFRVSELLSLQVRDVCKSGKMVERTTVQRRDMMRKVEGRTVYFRPQARAAIAARLVESKLQLNDYLFQSRQGGAMSARQAWNVLTAACKANNLTGTLGTDMMRKSYAGKVYEHFGHDLVKTQHAMGHKNINGTVSYLSFSEEEIDQAVMAIAIWKKEIWRNHNYKSGLIRRCLTN